MDLIFNVNCLLKCQVVDEFTDRLRTVKRRKKSFLVCKYNQNKQSRCYKLFSCGRKTLASKWCNFTFGI